MSFCLAVAMLSLAGGRAVAADQDLRVKEPISRPGALWLLTPEQRHVAQPVDFEGRVSYFDPRWRHCWIEEAGAGVYLFLSAAPPPLEQNQRVRITGEIVPDKGLEASRVRVEVLKAHELPDPLDATTRIGDRDALLSRVVTVRGYVDGQQPINDEHVRLDLIVEGEQVLVWVRVTNPDQVSDWRGRMVQITGLYQARFDPSGTQMAIELWTPTPDDIAMLGGLTESRWFEEPVTPVNEIYRAAPGRRVKLRGRVLSSKSGQMMILRDGTGQVEAYTQMRQSLAFGSEIELVGKPTVAAGRWTLQNSVFRVLAQPTPGADKELTTAEHIRGLSRAEAARGLPVDITAVVTWARPDREVFYVEDLTGGVRVRYHPEEMEAPRRNKYLRLQGVTFDGGLSPGVEVRRLVELGVMETPQVREITLEQAQTGSDDGQLVEMRGYFQYAVANGQQRDLHVATPTGEFVGEILATVDIAPRRGSLVRFRGACEVVPSADGRIHNVRLLMGSLSSAIVEEEAPADLYTLPRQSIATLHQRGNRGELALGHVAGTVLHVEAGQAIYLEDASGVIRVRTAQTLFEPGDQVETVGVLGREGVRADLREAICRQTGRGPVPTPTRLENPRQIDPSLDLRLVNVHGTLIDLAYRGGQTWLTLQAGSGLFEATLKLPPDQLAEAAAEVGAELAVTGIYRISFDDLRQSRDFELQLRSPADIVVTRTARLWTPTRALTAAAILAGLTLAGLAWVVLLRRRVRRQTEQIRAQLERQARLEAELQHTARLESLGVLAGGIAHDFNNLLTAIMGRLGLVLTSERLDPEAASHLHEISRAAGRARHLTRQLLTFAKGGDPIIEAVVLPDLVTTSFDAVLKASPPSAAAAVRTEVSVPADLWRVAADKDQLAQVLQNIVVNALEAMPRGGTLRAAMSNATMSAESGRGLTPGRYVRLAISDTGEGIAPEVVAKIFDPYFSTRPNGRGLGLATAYSIIARHHGRIEVTSTPGHGTTFHLWLPAPEKIGGSEPPFESVVVEAPRAEAPVPHGPPRILLMDDEESIRQVGAIVLRRAGFDVVAVAEGESAIREFTSARSAGRPFELLILDLTIPGGVGGRETMERIRALDPKIRAIVSSGYSNDPVMANFASYGFHAMVPKPYEIAVLMAAVEKVLGGLPPPPAR